MSGPRNDPYPPVVPAPGRDARAPGVTRDIYGMPAFVTFAVRDIEAVRDWYTRGLDFIDLFSAPGPTGVPLLVHLRRWRFQDLLLRPAEGEVVPGSAMTLSIAAVVGELDALADRARRHGGGQVEGPADTPWNTRDLRTRDLDGNVVVFTAPRPPEDTDPAFSARIRDLADHQLG